MAYSKDEKILISQLTNMVDELSNALDQCGEDTVKGYKYLHKVKNILKTKDQKGMRNVKQHLMMDFRIIEDRQLEGNTLDDIIDRIYKSVNSSEIFN